MKAIARCVYEEKTQAESRKTEEEEAISKLLMMLFFPVQRTKRGSYILVSCHGYKRKCCALVEGGNNGHRKKLIAQI